MNRTEAREKATALVAQMTIEEAASQLLHSSPAIPRLGIPAYDWWSEALHGVARAGTATCYPQAIGLGATFDRELLQKIAGSIALEARAKYNAYSRLGGTKVLPCGLPISISSVIPAGEEARRPTEKIPYLPLPLAVPLWKDYRPKETVT